MKIILLLLLLLSNVCTAQIKNNLSFRRIESGSMFIYERPDNKYFKDGVIYPYDMCSDEKIPEDKNFRYLDSSFITYHKGVKNVWDHSMYFYVRKNDYYIPLVDTIKYPADQIFMSGNKIKIDTIKVQFMLTDSTSNPVSAVYYFLPVQRAGNENRLFFWIMVM